MPANRFSPISREKLYFGVGKFKAVYRQMQANPYVEICATANGKILRYYGRAVFENDYQIAHQVLSSSPALQTIYNETTGYKLGIFHLEDATAEFRNMMSIEESFHFA